jgi:hypothetical protein
VVRFGDLAGERCMATPAYLKTFRAFIDTPPAFAHLQNMEQEFYLGSDRAAVILQAANVEDTLESLIRTKLRRPLPADLDHRLFETEGPFATFSRKILAGFAFELFGPIYRHDLNTIRELRNGFAHVRIPMTFTTPEVAGMCEHLEIPELQHTWLPGAYSAGCDLEIATDKNHPRTRFTRACHTISLCFIELREALLGNPHGVRRDLP